MSQDVLLEMSAGQHEYATIDIVTKSWDSGMTSDPTFSHLL
jgi:hypothetical protein